MCLAIPMKIQELTDAEMAKVEVDGTVSEANVSLIESPQPGDYVIVHAGFAIEKIDTEEAEKTIELLKGIAGLEDEIY